MRGSVVALAMVLVLLPGCKGGASGDPASGIPVITQGSDDPSLPYGIVAIDYHFHDAHPSIPLDLSRDVTFSNAGSLLHNVTFPQFGYSKDLPVGSTIEIRNLGEKLGGPGIYTFFCSYHASSFGMIGTIVIT
jgi:hypothetical protein